MFFLLKRAKLFAVILIILIGFGNSSAAPELIKPNGFGGGATGGGNATPKEVSSASEFKKLVGGSSPEVIIVKGSLNVGSFSIGSNKTIIGATKDAGAHGGTISASGNNVIIQNMTFGPVSGDNTDVMELSGATNFFFVKCTFHDGTDELLSFVNKSDNITVSWCKFYFDKTHSHAFAHLMAKNDGASGNRGKLRITFHHNWYSKGIVERQPRARYGQIHAYNNLYESDKTNYVFGVGVESQFLVEGCYFKDQGKQTWYDWTKGKIHWDPDNNIFAGNTTMSTWATNSEVFKPPYEYTVDRAEDVPAMVRANAGNVPGTVNARDAKRVSASQKSSLVEFITINRDKPQLHFRLVKNSTIKAIIHDTGGRVVATVLDGTLAAGTHRVELDHYNLPGGVYYVQFTVDECVNVVKVSQYQ